MTKGLLISINHKEQLYNLVKKNNNKSLYLIKYYNKFCKILKKVIIAAKNLNDSINAGNNLKNSKKIWNFINQKLGKNNYSKSTDIKSINNNNDFLTNKSFGKRCKNGRGENEPGNVQSQLLNGRSWPTACDGED